ncbi:hypothetical protein NQZ79_g2719 [Umbelopsis isabellina]|nr:hypothetical protein NQZ79_g2719 [Umbelopsis isabellina]
MNLSSSGAISEKDLQIQQNENILLEPFRYLCEHPGKDIRTQLIEAFDYYMHVPADELRTIKKITEMLHNASLLNLLGTYRVDDVEDDSDLRRGVPVAHKIYGIAQTVNCANYVYFLALNEILKLGNAKMVDIYTEELINLHKGQGKLHARTGCRYLLLCIIRKSELAGMELFWRDSLTCPTQEEYIQMVNNSENWWITAARCQTDASGKPNRPYADNKGFCEDFTEGKFSFPVIHSIRTDPSNRQLLNILKQKSTSVELKRFGLQLLEKTDTFNYCLEFLSDIERQARDEIYQLGANPKLEKILDLLTVSKSR